MDNKLPEGISSHFEREAKLMVGLFLVLILVALLAGLFGQKVLRFLEIDKCLDAGGSFNSEKHQCEFANDEKQQ